MQFDLDQLDQETSLCCECSLSSMQTLDTTPNQVEMDQVSGLNLALMRQKAVAITKRLVMIMMMKSDDCESLSACS